MKQYTKINICNINLQPKAMYILSVLQITAGKIYPLIQLIPFFLQNSDSII